MKRLVMILLSVVVIPMLVGSAESAEIKDLISGEMFPLTMQLKDLDDDWRAMTVGGMAAMGDLSSIYASMFGGDSHPFYTRGETVSVGEETFIVGYQARTEPFNFFAQMMTMGGRGGRLTREKLTPETPLALSLVKLETVSGFSDIRAFDLDQEIAESERLAESVEEDWQEDLVLTSLSNLRQVGLAALMYAMDWDEVLPPMEDPATVEEALWPYVKNRDLFYHPATGDSYLSNASLSGKLIADFEHPEDMVMFYEATPWGDGSRAAVFVDGHAKRLDAKEWERLKRISGIP